MLAISVGIGLCDAAYAQSKNKDDPNAGEKRIVRNLATIAITFIAGKLGGEFGEKAGGAIGAAIGSLSSPAGSTVGAAVGTGVGGTLGSIGASYLAAQACDYVFDKKLKW